MTVISQKICLIGDFGVGKTSLIRRFIEGVFSDKYLTTIGIKVSRKLICLEALAQEVDLIIWDLEGHTRFKSITPNYLKGAKGAIIVGDLSRQETLDNIQKHIDLFLTVNPQGLAIIALNKYDLIEAKKLAKLIELNNFLDNSQVIDTIITSAKNNTNVDKAFWELAAKIINK
ncbi:MAG TPA: Rab family GTPase [Xenococcaceae cyanobacterium]|jgi:small GTP-binding protein